MGGKVCNRSQTSVCWRDPPIKYLIYRQSSIKPPGAYLIYEVLEGGLIEGSILERGANLKIKDQGYTTLARYVEERTGQESSDP